MNMNILKRTLNPRAAVAAMAFAALMAVGTPAHAETRAEVMRMIITEAEAMGLSPALALAVAQVESNFDARAESPKGARGVMQIMPGTAWEMGVHPDELWDARLNVQVGIDFLQKLIKRYNGRWDLALSYYNGGSAVGSGASARVLPYTRGYVTDVLAAQKRYEDQAVVWRDVGPTPLNDGWAPAGTRVAEVAPQAKPAATPATPAPARAGLQLVPMPAEPVPVRAAAPAQVRVVVTWHAAQSPARIASVKGDDFDARLAKARAQLDADFGPNLPERLANAGRTLDAGGPARRG